MNGCSLNPGHPNRITPRALDEMEEKYPGYKHHIELVKMAIPRLNSYSNTYRTSWPFVSQFMNEQGVVAGVV
jgi:hypothetical protein